MPEAKVNLDQITCFIPLQQQAFDFQRLTPIDRVREARTLRGISYNLEAGSNIAPFLTPRWRIFPTILKDTFKVFDATIFHQTNGN